MRRLRMPDGIRLSVDARRIDPRAPRLGAARARLPVRARERIANIIALPAAGTLRSGVRVLQDGRPRQASLAKRFLKRRQGDSIK